MKIKDGILKQPNSLIELIEKASSISSDIENFLAVCFLFNFFKN